MFPASMDQRFDKMTKEELISHIQEGIKTEESAVTIYSRHLAAIVSRSGLPDSDIAELKRVLGTLIQENQRHKRILSALLRQVQGESIDVY